LQVSSISFVCTKSKKSDAREEESLEQFLIDKTGEKKNQLPMAKSMSE
jgi:hypothetical protein